MSPHGNAHDDKMSRPICLSIDLPSGKNLAGAFYQPRLVICDPDTLSTLPSAILADGCAEVMKYGVIIAIPTISAALLGLTIIL